MILKKLKRKTKKLLSFLSSKKSGTQKEEKNAYNFRRLRRWKNFHGGEKCILLCNGPSLNNVLFKNIDLNNYTIFGLNKIYLGFESLGIQPKYIVSVNKKVLEQSATILNTLEIVKFISNRVNRELITPDQFTFHMETTQLPKSPKRFSEDISQYVYEGWTVTHAALQVIYYMGFNEVNIVGMDHRFKQHEEGKENQASVIEGDDIDHFHPNYFGHGQSWDFPDLKNSEISYKAARTAYEKRGSRIFDCTIDGACRVFERRDITKHLYSKNMK